MSNAHSKISRGLQNVIDGKVRIWTPADTEAAKARACAMAESAEVKAALRRQVEQARALREIVNGY